MPTFGVMMIFISYILPYSNNGPLWNGVVKEAEYCRSNWIVGLLAMNNIFKTDRLVRVFYLLQVQVNYSKFDFCRNFSFFRSAFG